MGPSDILEKSLIKFRVLFIDYGNEDLCSLDCIRQLTLPNNSLKTCKLAVDIGTGASCIFPLLGVRVMQDTCWIATEVVGYA